MQNFYVNESFDMGGRSTIEKGGKTVSLSAVVDALNKLQKQNTLMIEALEKIYAVEPLENTPDFLSMKIAADALDIVNPTEVKGG